MTPPESSDVPTKEELKAAFKSFKKRLKLTRLDAESKLNYGPMSGSNKAAILAITPPWEFRQAIWDELVRQGKIKHVGQGTYELVGE